MAEDREVEEHDLSSVIAGEIRQAKAYDRTELAGKRARAIDYLRGVMSDTPPRPNGSRQTDRTFADTVSWILPGVVRVFISADQMVQYTKVREENDDWARDASEYTNYTFLSENDGYRILYNATYDALTLGNGVVCSYWEPERITTRIFRDRTEMELADLIEKGWQPTGVVKPGKPKSDLVDDGSGEYVEMEVPTLTVKLGMVDRPGKICDVTCKPENLLLNQTATTIEDARFCAYYHDDKTRSDLMEMAADYGWDTETIRNLPAFNSVAEDEVSLARDFDQPMNNTSTLRSADAIDLYECYIRADLDGDGIAELVQAWYAGEGAGGTLLGFEEWEDDVPYTDIPCYPVPHRFDAESVFDRTEDIQRVKTVVARGLIDNVYAVGLPMFEAEAESIKNPDILASPKFGGTIWRTKGSIANAPIVRHEFPFVADKLQVALAYMDEMVAKRTGVSRTTMALDPEALQNQTATASAQQRDAGYSQIELIARNMAELGWVRFFRKRLKLAIKHQKVRKIPSKKEETGFRDIDPSDWDANMAVSINTGLGTGSRDRDMAMLNVIKNGQMMMAQMLAASGLHSKALEFLPKIRMTAVAEAEASGLKSPEDYYPEITDEEVVRLQEQAAQPKPNPKIEEIMAQGQVQAQLKQVELQAQGQLEQQKLMAQVDAERLKAEGNAVKEQAQLNADIQTSNLDRQNELILEEKRQQIEREKIASNERIKLAELAQQRELEILKLNAIEVEEQSSETDAEGKPKGGTKTKRRVVDGSTAMIEKLVAMLSAPVEIVRGPDGKAVGTRRRVN